MTNEQKEPITPLKNSEDQLSKKSKSLYWLIKTNSKGSESEQVKVWAMLGRQELAKIYRKIMVNEKNVYLAENKKPVELVQELKDEYKVPSFEEFMETYE